MIKVNRVYKTKSGQFVKVDKITQNCVHGTYLDENCTSKGGFTSTYENFKKAVNTKPVRLTNTAEVEGEEIHAKESNVFYSHGVVCKNVENNEVGIGRCIDINTAHSSLKRNISDTERMGYGHIFTYFIVTLKHKIIK